MGGSLCDLELSNNFLDTTPNAQAIKGKIDKLNLIKIKNFCVLKEDCMKKVKRQPIEWEKIFANHKSEKGLVSRTLTIQ